MFWGDTRKTPAMKPKGTRKKKSRIPSFKNYEEEAHFWDTHSFTDYWDELKPVKVRFAKNLSDTLTLRLDAPTLIELRQKAQNIGVGPTTLARMWILEKLQPRTRGVA